MKKADSQLIQGLQSQLTFEYFSEKVYQSASWQLDALNLEGMAKYLKARAGEEAEHAAKIAQFLSDRDISPIVDAIPVPAIKISSDIFKAGNQAFAAALEQERANTKRLRALHELADNVGDPETCIFLQWFLMEQVEEEKTLEVILTKFELASGNGAAILMIDKQLGE